MRKAVPLAVLVSGLVLASLAAADVTITIKRTSGLDENKPHVSTGTMSFNAHCMATNWEGTRAERGRMIFRGDKELMWIVNDGKKSYQQIDKAYVDQAAAQVADAKAQMQAQLEKMPPEQRAQAEAMMKKFGGGAANAGPALKIEYRKTAETKLVNGQMCTKYDAYLGKDLTAHLWVAPYSAMKFSPSDAAVFQEMGEFFEKLTSSFGGSQRQDYLPMHELNGVPLLSQDLDDGRVTSETLVQSVSRAPLAPGSFELPGGYKAEPMPGAQRRR